MLKELDNTLSILLKITVKLFLIFCIIILPIIILTLLVISK